MKIILTLTILSLFAGIAVADIVKPLLSEMSPEQVNSLSSTEVTQLAIEEVGFWKARYAGCFEQNEAFKQMVESKTLIHTNECGCSGSSPPPILNFASPALGNNWCDGADINHDGRVDMDDDLSQVWNNNYGRIDCSAENNWCNLADRDKNGIVDQADYVENLKWNQNYGRIDCAA